MMMMVMHVVVMTAAGIVRRGHVARILSRFHSPILFLRAPRNLLLLLLLHLHRLLSRLAFSVILVRTFGTRWFNSRSMTVTRWRADLDAVCEEFCGSLEVHRASQKVQGEGFPSSATLFLAPASQIWRRLGVATGGGAMAFLEGNEIEGKRYPANNNLDGRVNF